MNWFSTIRAALELLYFISGIAMAVAAILALGQIRLTKQIATGNARRESVKLAADLCRYFAESVVPLWIKANDDYTRLGLKCLSAAPPQGQPAFLIKNGEIKNHYFNLKTTYSGFPKMVLSNNLSQFLRGFFYPICGGCC
jgi:hypothetical protein